MMMMVTGILQYNGAASGGGSCWRTTHPRRTLPDIKYNNKARVVFYGRLY